MGSHAPTRLAARRRLLPLTRVVNTSHPYCTRPSSHPYSTLRTPLFIHIGAGAQQASRVALVGPNGSGKSTLLNLIQGKIDAPISSLSHPYLIPISSLYNQPHSRQDRRPYLIPISSLSHPYIINLIQVKINELASACLAPISSLSHLYLMPI